MEARFVPMHSLPSELVPWVKMPDPKVPLTVTTHQPGQRESAVTKVAKALYKWNRMEWRTGVPALVRMAEKLLAKRKRGESV